MIYFTLVFSAINVVIKRFGRLLLALPFFMLLIGCDSSSSTTSDTDSSTVTQTASVDSAQNTAEARQNSDGNDNANSDNELSGVDEGQSLISAIKVGDGAQAQRTPMISGALNNSTLQATLIGDYIGMLPCLFCDDIDITLNLFADGSILKTSVYNNPESPKVLLVESGTYRQDGNTITIVYENKNIETYRIQDNHLVMLDKDQNPNADYTLSRK